MRQPCKLVIPGLLVETIVFVPLGALLLTSLFEVVRLLIDSIGMLVIFSRIFNDGLEDPVGLSLAAALAVFRTGVVPSL